MTGHTSPYRRKSDGGRRRDYRCINYHHATGVCDSRPIDAALVDAAVVSDLRTLLVDFEGWRDQIEDRHSAERGRLAREVERAVRDRDEQAKSVAGVERQFIKHSGTDESKADLILPILEQQRKALEDAELRRQAAEDALSSVPTEAPTDAMLDFMTSLQAAINGRLDDTGSLGEVNMALRDLFSRFVLGVAPAITVKDGKVRADPGRGDEVLIQPFLRADVLAFADEWAFAEHEGWPKLVATDEQPPPLHLLKTGRSETGATPRRSGG